MSGAIRWMFHATAMVRDFDAVVATMEALFGCRVLHVTSDAERIGRRGGMTWVGDNSLEIGEPAGATSAVASFIERFGPGMHSVAVQVDDVDESAERLGVLGVRVASKPYDGLMFTRPADTEGLLIEWYSNQRDDDPRFGAVVPSADRPAAVPVRRVAYVGAAVEDPDRSAARLARIFGTQVLEMPEPRGATEPAAAVSLGECVLALFDVGATAGQSALFGRPVNRPQIHTIAFQVDDLASASAALRGCGIRLLTAERGLLVPDPEDVGMSVVLTDVLLPGDPRRSTQTPQR